jgi:branched-subunit amino acid ABC-type transport system permease component
VTILLHSIGYGFVTAAIVALASVAFSLQFSVTTTPNFAHGELLTAGAYGAYVAQKVSHNLAIDALAAMAAGTIVATILNLSLIQPYLKAGSKRLTLFLVTVAAGWIIQDIILIFFGSAPSVLQVPGGKLHHIGPFLWTGFDMTIMGMAIVILGALHVTLRYTKFGKSLRAVSDNPQLARITGIKYPQVVRLTWAIDGLIAGFAGFVLGAYVGSITPTLGFSFLVVVFAAAVLGGLGKPYGTLVGALVIGLSMEVSAAYLPAEYKQSIAFLILIGTLLFRPRGIFSSEVWNMAQ